VANGRDPLKCGKHSTSPAIISDKPQRQHSNPQELLEIEVPFEGIVLERENGGFSEMIYKMEVKTK